MTKVIGLLAAFCNASITKKGSQQTNHIYHESIIG